MVKIITITLVLAVGIFGFIYFSTLPPKHSLDIVPQPNIQNNKNDNTLIENKNISDSVKQKQTTKTNIVTPTPPTKTIIPPVTISPSPAFQLQSNFLKNEPIAEQIASGQLKSYDIKKYNFVYGENTPTANSNDFAYRFTNAIKMTGQIITGNTIGGHYASEDFLNKFQSFWNFPLSSNIDANVLKKVDSILASKEAGEKNIAMNFPLYDHFIDAPKNQETKIHSAYLFAQTFKELPDSLVVWSEQNFKDYFSHQLSGHYDNINSGDYKICDIFLYDNLGDNCKPISGNHPKVLDDFDSMDTKIHEYAHYLDRNLYSRNESTSQGLIDTTGFYSISYDVNQRDTTATWPSYKLRNPNNEKNEFIGAYAMGWTTPTGYKSSVEDFAESFAMYITQGKAFRTIAANNSVLKQKYDWLKQNVFGGTEYQSGASNALEYTKNNPNKMTVATGVFNIRDFTEYYPNFVWNYKFLNGSIVPKP